MGIYFFQFEENIDRGLNSIQNFLFSGATVGSAVMNIKSMKRGFCAPFGCKNQFLNPLLLFKWNPAAAITRIDLNIVGERLLQLGIELFNVIPAINKKPKSCLCLQFL